MANKTQYWFLLTVLQDLFQQCEYCEVGNGIIEFFTSLMPKKVTSQRRVIRKTFSSICDAENTILTCPPHSILSVTFLTLYVPLQIQTQKHLTC